MAQVDELVGQTFGKLVVRERAPNQRGRAVWICACACGELTTVRSDNLKSGMVRSCGKCGAFHSTGNSADSIRYTVECWGDTSLGTTTDAMYSWGQATDSTGAVVARTTKPGYRTRTKGEQHPAASRVLNILASMELINPQNNRTYRRWVLEEGVVVKINGTSIADTDSAYYATTGETPPLTNAQRAAQPTVYVDRNPLTDAQKEAVQALMDKWAAH